MKLEVGNYAELTRDPKWESQLARDLRGHSESDNLQFLSELLCLQPVVALEVARRCLRERKSFEAILERGLREADASSIREWLACVTPRMGLRNVLRYLRSKPAGCRRQVLAATYFLHEFLDGSGCTEEDIKGLGDEKQGQGV